MEKVRYVCIMFMINSRVVEGLKIWGVNILIEFILMEQVRDDKGYENIWLAQIVFEPGTTDPLRYAIWSYDKQRCDHVP